MALNPGDKAPAIKLQDQSDTTVRMPRLAMPSPKASTGSAQGVVRFAVPFWLLSSMTAWVFAAMLTEICTTDNRCTLMACPAACDRPENVLIMGFLAMTGAFVAAPLLARRFSRARALAPGILAWFATIAALVASPG